MFKITHLSQSVWNFIRTEHLIKEVCASFNVLKFKCISIVFAQPGNLILTLYKDLKPGHKHAFNLQPISIVPPSM